MADAVPALATISPTTATNVTTSHRPGRRVGTLPRELRPVPAEDLDHG
ncbi:hypothetical protein ACWEOO_18340 [Kribbella sp. NPDC004138]